MPSASSATRLIVSCEVGVAPMVEAVEGEVSEKAGWEGGMGR